MVDVVGLYSFHDGRVINFVLKVISVLLLVFKLLNNLLIFDTNVFQVLNFLFV